MKSLPLKIRVFQARRRHRGCNAARAGMTLIEVMLAMAILVTGLIAIFALLSTAIQSHRRAVAETEVAMIASSVLSELRGEFASGHIPRSDAKGKFEETPDFPDYGINRQIIPLERRRGASGVGGSASDEALDREYFVRVEVRWSQRGENKSVAVQTIIFNNRKLGRASIRR